MVCQIVEVFSILKSWSEEAAHPPPTNTCCSLLSQFLPGIYMLMNVSFFGAGAMILGVPAL